MKRSNVKTALFFAVTAATLGIFKLLFYLDKFSPLTSYPSTYSMYCIFLICPALLFFNGLFSGFLLEPKHHLKYILSAPLVMYLYFVFIHHAPDFGYAFNLLTELIGLALLYSLPPILGICVYWFINAFVRKRREFREYMENEE